MPAAELFAWHARPGAFERLVPPWDDVRVVARRGSIHDGDTLQMAVRQGPFTLTWLARHEGFKDERRFVDVQDRGPFAAWRHVHDCEPLGPARSALVDRIDYRLPLAPVSHWVAGAFVRRTLDRMFAFRHARTVADLTRHARYLGQPRLTVGLDEADHTRLQDLAAVLSTGGHTVLLVRAVDGVACARAPFDPSAEPTPCRALDVAVITAPAQRQWAAQARHGAVPAPAEHRDWQARDTAVWHTCDALLQRAGLRPAA